MDPFPQYSSHAFIPYLSPNSPTASAPTSPSSPSSPYYSPASSRRSSESDLPPLALLNSSSWTYCGPLLSPSPNTLPQSLHTWIQHTITGPFLTRFLPFLHWVNAFLQDANLSHYWLTIRATKPTSEYDTVRWHTDDVFFDEETRSSQSTSYWKLATTLLGPPTLFIRDSPRARRLQHEAKAREHDKRPEHTCTSFRCLGCVAAVEAVRATLAEEFEHEDIESPAFGEAAFFRLGDSVGAVHSEPRCPVDRIFVNVVPGSHAELQSLMSKWGLSFPRSWSFGVPVGFQGLSDHEDEVRNAVMGESICEVVEQESLYSAKGGRTSPSTMSLSLGMKEEYGEWLRQKGFRYSQVFGQEREAGQDRQGAWEGQGLQGLQGRGMGQGQVWGSLGSSSSGS